MRLLIPASSSLANSALTSFSFQQASNRAFLNPRYPISQMLMDRTPTWVGQTCSAFQTARRSGPPGSRGYVKMRAKVHCHVRLHIKGTTVVTRRHFRSSRSDLENTTIFQTATIQIKCGPIRCKQHIRIPMPHDDKPIPIC